MLLFGIVWLTKIYNLTHVVESFGLRPKLRWTLAEAKFSTFGRALPLILEFKSSSILLEVLVKWQPKNCQKLQKKIMPTTIYLETPKNFNFEQTLFGHGWSQLAPFEVDRENLILSRVFSAAEVPISTQISESGEKIEIEIAEDKLDRKAKNKILRDVRHVLRLGDDLQGFYQSTALEKRLAWIAANNAGRLLRSPTVYEDLVKTICTTNCSWALTKKMTANLTEKLGEAAKDGRRAFPTAEKMAGVSAEFYKDEIRAGYRSGYFAELAEKVAGGVINPENWLDSDLPTKELKKQMKQIKGVGDYAAENLLKLVGRYDGLALDSYLRAQFYARHNGGEICEDKQIENFYQPFGDWRGLTIWCDMSESKS